MPLAVRFHAAVWATGCHHLAEPARVSAFTNSRRLIKVNKSRLVHVKAEKEEEQGDGIGEQREKLEKLSKISGGQYLFNRVREKADGKIQRLVNRSREDWLEYEKKELFRTEAKTAEPNVYVGAPIIVAKNLIRTALLFVFQWPLTFLIRTIAGVAGSMSRYVNKEQFEMFMMSEGEKIWRWRNRTHNERWFWSFFLFRSLLPTLMGIVVYEAFVPNNIIWAVVIPYLFYWNALGTLLSPFNFDWWLLMYFGFYAKCWPGIASLLSTFFLG